MGLCLRLNAFSKPHLEKCLELGTHFLSNVRGTWIWKFSMLFFLLNAKYVIYLSKNLLPARKSCT